MKRVLAEQQNVPEMSGEQAASLGLAYQDWGEDLDSSLDPNFTQDYDPDQSLDTSLDLNLNQSSGRVSGQLLEQELDQDLEYNSEQALEQNVEPTSNPKLVLESDLEMEQGLEPEQEQEHNPDLDQQDFLQDYALTEPTPITRKTNIENVPLKHGKHKLRISIIIILTIVALGGMAGWWFWQSSRDEVVAEDLQDNPIDEPIYLNTLDLSHEDVVKAYDIIKKVVYAEPFVSFYPLGELTLDDLTDAQREIMLDSSEIIAEQVNEALSVYPEAENMTLQDSYMHILYLAEYDTENLYLSENIIKSRLTSCEDGIENLEAACFDYYNLGGKKLEITEDDLAGGELQDRSDGIDRYKWTFRKDENGNYVFAKVTRVMENSQN